MNEKLYQNYNGYTTDLGQCVCGDSLELLKNLPCESVDLFITSPPFALQRKKDYGNEEQDKYVDWLCSFGKIVYEKLKPNGSFVIDIGGAYEKGVPIYSLYQYRTLIKLCDEIGFFLAQPFYWYNPSSLPTPIEWVNKRKLRAKSSVDTVWWLCKSYDCKADITKVLSPYSDRMKRLINHPEEFIKKEGTIRPSGHVLGKSSWQKNNGGAIPSNLLQISNSESNSQYLRICKQFGIKSHPARFPQGLPEFFIKFLTDESDLVVDIFSGSNTTGYVAERMNRKWISYELSLEYVATSAFRFLHCQDDAKKIYNDIKSGKNIKFDSMPQQLQFQLYD